MEIFILDEFLRSFDNIDAFESLIWTERYIGYGDFEFYTSVNTKMLQIVAFIQSKLEQKLDVYVWLKESGSVMIIETLQILTDVENGDRFVMSGRGLESILERRIVWNMTMLDGNLQDEVERLLNESIINPSIPERKIANFVFKRSDDPEITSLKVSSQYTGDVIFDVVYTLCETNGLGFDITFDGQNKFIFQLRKGKNRSYNQVTNPYVEFSPRFENITNSDYLESIKTLKNVTLVAGEDRESNRKTKVVGSASGLNRRELYTDARDIQSEEDGATIPEDKYYGMLEQRGTEKLSEHQYLKAFTGGIEAIKMFIYGKDFFIGDIVQIINEFKMESVVRVSELVRIQDQNGYNAYPTFQVIE